MNRDDKEYLLGLCVRFFLMASAIFLILSWRLS